MRAAAAAAMLCFAAPATAQPEPPALLVVLAVDQLRAGYIETYGHQWHAGLRRLIDDGAWFENAAYPYRATVTCAGHATIATGSFPARHGMVGNSWWDRADAAQVSCTTDASQTPIAYGGQARERHGPAPLRTATLADVLRAEASGQSRVVSMSLKPRSAITLAGQAADAVTWFDAGGVWATSTAYASAPVDAVRQFVAAHPVEQFAGEAWQRLLPPAHTCTTTTALASRRRRDGMPAFRIRSARKRRPGRRRERSTRRSTGAGGQARIRTSTSAAWRAP